MKDLPTALAESLHVLAASKLIAAVAVVASHGDLAAKRTCSDSTSRCMWCVPTTLARQMTMSAGVHALVMDDSPASFPSRFVQKLKKKKRLRVAVALHSYSHRNEVRLSVIG